MSINGRVSTKKVDRRVRRTRDRLGDALVDLLRPGDRAGGDGRSVPPAVLDRRRRSGCPFHRALRRWLAFWLWSSHASAGTISLGESPRFTLDPATLAVSVDSVITVNFRAEAVPIAGRPLAGKSARARLADGREIVLEAR